MKILIFVTNFYPYLGGLENYVLELSKRLIKKGIRVDILAYNIYKIKEFEKYEGINIYRIPCFNVLKGVYSLPQLNIKTKEILKKLSQNDYDFVITQTRFFSSSWLGMLFAKKNKIRLIHTEHGNVFVKHKNKLIQFFSWLYDISVGKRIFKNAWKVIGISKACCDFAKKRGAKNVFLVYNCVNLNLFKKQKYKSDLRKKLKIKNKFVITFTGRLIYAKGVQDLINAVESIKNIKLLIIGEGPYKEYLKRIAKKKKIDASFLGQKSQEEIVDILNISDIFINPSFSEGLPTSVLEAGAVGLPIIATAVGGTEEIIKNYKTGILVKPNNTAQLRKKILELIKDKELRERLSKEVQKTVRKKFNWDDNIKRFIEILQK